MMRWMTPPQRGRERTTTMGSNRRLSRSYLDEIAGLLAQGYVRLQQKRARRHTPDQHSPDDGAFALDSLRQAEPFIGTERLSSTGGCS